MGLTAFLQGTLDLVFFGLFDIIMAIVLSPEQKAAAMKMAGADLQFLLDRKMVPEDMQAVLYHIGVVTVEAFAVLAKNQGELEEILETNFGVDMKKLEDKVKAGRVVTAWLAAKARATKQADLEGDCEVRRVPKDMSVTDLSAMRAAFERKY